MLVLLSGALRNLSGMVKLYFPQDLKEALQEMAAEIDSLKIEINQLKKDLQK
jgi:hypothetical protein